MSPRCRTASSLVIALACVPLIWTAPAVAGEFVVNSKADGAKAAPGAICETATPGQCTLRAAIEAANASPDQSWIRFEFPMFHGEGDAIITPATPLPTITQPVELHDSLCVSRALELIFCVEIEVPPYFPGISVEADEAVVEHLAIFGGSVGIEVIGSGSPAAGARIRENLVAEAGTGIATTGPIEGSGNLIEGNLILVEPGFNSGITLTNGPNRVYGNEIEGEGCCYPGVTLEGAADGNRIGGDSVASENVIEGFLDGAVSLVLPEATRNEVGRNRGDNGGKFIGLLKANAGEPNRPNAIAPPRIEDAGQSSAAGTARPGARVRVFRKATARTGELAGFLGEAVADAAGSWRVGFGPVAVGTLIAATQTLGGGTSELSATAGTVAHSAPPCAACVPTPDTEKPKVTIKKAPKAKSKSTTAKFVFSSDESGSSFQCRLDKRKFAKCRSPKTYRKLKPGRHVFKVRATDAAGNLGAAVTRRFTVLE